MSDIVDRLIALGATLANDEAETVQQAANEIARLTAEVERLRKVHEAELGVCEQYCDVVMRLRAVVDAARSERRKHEDYEAGVVCTCALCDAIRALDGEA